MSALAAYRVHGGLLPHNWFDPVLDAKARQITRLAHRGYRPKVVAVGHSVVFDWLDPQVFTDNDLHRRRAYNAGANLAVGEVAEDLLAFVLSVWKPDVVILGFSAIELNENGIEQQRCVARHQATLAGRRRGRLGPSLRTVRVLWSLIPRNRTFLLALYRGRQALPEAARLIGPFGTDLHKLGKEYQCNDGFVGAFRDRWLNDYAISPAEMERLRRMIRMVRENGARPVAVAAPMTADFTAVLPGGEATMKLMHAFWGELCEAENALFVTPPRDLLPDELFADPVHLNDRGIRVMSGWIAQQGF